MDLGSFLEIEVIDATDKMDIAKMKELCAFYMDLLEVKKEDLFENSYSDMILS
jgi:adenylate cyclase class IV